MIATLMREMRSRYVRKLGDLPCDDCDRIASFWQR